jgi:hypothetical protein
MYQSAAPAGRISMKFHTRDIYENLSQKSNLIKIGQNIGVFRERPQVRFIAASDTE